MFQKGETVQKKDKAEPTPTDTSKGEKSRSERSKNLLLATDSAIDRLRDLSQPGGEIENMDIKDLKNLISSIKELSTISNELVKGEQKGGVVILPEVKIDE